MAGFAARGAYARHHVFFRAIGKLRPEAGKALALAASGGLVALLQVVEPVLFGRAINGLTSGANPLPFVAMWCGISIAAFLGGMVISLGADRLAHRRRLAAMARFVEHLLALPPAFHFQARAGRLMRIMISGCENLFALWLPLLREQIVNGVILLALLPIAVVTNWRLALVLVALLVAYTGVNLVVLRRTSHGQAHVENQFTDLSGQLGDLFGNVTVLQSFLAVPGELRSIRTSLHELLHAQYPVLNWWAVSAVLTRGASSIAIVSIFAIGASLAAHHLATVGDVVTFVGFATLMIARLEQLTSFIVGLAQRFPALEQFFDVLDEESHIKELPGAAPLQVTRGHIRFDEVSFRYPGGNGRVQNLSFEVQPGETIAIVGPTGSGKSTALGLFQRAFDPDAGRILIDGQDIKSVTLASLRASTGVVFQEAGLFNRSIAENIAMGDPHATMERIEAAARLAGCHDFIIRKEGGYAAPVGDRGQGLSGGERQRIAIARALLKNAPILLLDEATSALDVATEARLQASLDLLREGRTTFVIAHRLSTIRSADRIIVLDHGRMIETGTFDELVARGGTFAGLARDAGLAEGRPAVALAA
ncbi:ATP-binding cassette domain-containing protein [Sphingomonas nostoxanthinifaciens]|uniref:ATP-binding cassette domain-containing protein n=1 Tax=Sphingomonas nostoxanthinifaciens TaxID=2872652 RepID=UPI001CC1D86A|nr:ATP-binding cassette domain-containing protein [Sphingomonas nostoxanthinifaciens]UAK23311.1 ATP-binding cassette domain-containing protein [Sphingomonas nostoxanthinifaciens]